MRLSFVRRSIDMRRSPCALRAGPRRRARTARAGFAAGFTLIEVLVALAIVAIGLVAALRAVGSVATNTAALHARLLAGWSADNTITMLHLQRSWPSFGVTSVPCPQGGLALVCDMTVTPTPNPAFRRVEVSVRSAVTGKTMLADLVTVVADETHRPL